MHVQTDMNMEITGTDGGSDITYSVHHHKSTKSLVNIKRKNTCSLHEAKNASHVSGRGACASKSKSSAAVMNNAGVAGHVASVRPATSDGRWIIWRRVARISSAFHLAGVSTSQVPGDVSLLTRRQLVGQSGVSWHCPACAGSVASVGARSAIAPVIGSG